MLPMNQIWPVLSSPIAVPPYGRDTDNTLQSVFEIKHLRSQAFFSNTQCERSIIQLRIEEQNIYRSDANAAWGVYLGESL
jgi:hypothetical protein